MRTRFLTCICVKFVRAFCACVGHLSLTCTVHYLHYNDTYIYAYNILANYITYTYTTYTCTTLQYDTEKRFKEIRNYLQYDTLLRTRLILQHNYLQIDIINE